MAHRYHPYNDGLSKGSGKSWSKGGGKAGSAPALVNAPWPENYGVRGGHSKICAYFAQGNCRKGASCDFAHILPNDTGAGGANTKVWQSREVSASAGGKWKMCAFFAQGTCKKGAACDFAHGESELQGEAPTTQAYQGSGNAAWPGQVVIRRTCTFFLQGNCKKGSLCEFSHEDDGVAGDSGQIVKQDDARYKTQLCRHFSQSAGCPRGDACSFAHGDHELRGGEPWAPQPPMDPRWGAARPPMDPRSDPGRSVGGDGGLKRMCDDWLAGYCAKGDACNLIHGKSSMPAAPWQKSKAAGAGAKSRLCTFFMQDGFCRKGNDCDFAHGEHELYSYESSDRMEVVSDFGGSSSAIAKDDARYKTQLCRHFSTPGGCDKGDACTFAHGLEELRQNDGQVVSDLPALPLLATEEDARYKTQLCRHFSSATGCERGAACNFAHGYEELRRGQGATPRSDEVETVGWDRGFKKMCDDWLQGLCRKGEACNFIHGKTAASGNDRHAAGSVYEPSGPPFKSRLCAFFRDQGFCRKGDACDFAHGEHELQVEGSQIVQVAATEYGSFTGPAPFKTKMCNFFLQGACTRGSSCTFAHGEHELQTSQAVELVVKQEHGEVGDVASLLKTKLCSYYLQPGGCWKGEQCSFAHGVEELQAGMEGTVESVGGADAGEKSGLGGGVKRKLCSFFMEQGFCKKGSLCDFAHGESELGSNEVDEISNTKDDADAVAEPARAKTTLCRFFERGFCEKGSACTFAHGPHELRSQAGLTNGFESADVSGGSIRLMCKYFLQGSCKKGDRCDFAHEDHSSSNGGVTPDTASKSPARRRLCDYFIQGICKKGKDCEFPHDQSELDPSEAPKIVKPPSRPIAQIVAEKRKAKDEQPEESDANTNPDDWEALEDEDGEVYYHHMPSGRTQWEPPQLPPILQAAAEVNGAGATSDV